VRVNVGDVVKKGQVLAVFSADTVNADVAQAQAALQEAQANAAEAAANAARAAPLQSSGALSEQQISQYLTAERTAARASKPPGPRWPPQQLRLRYTQVVAPDSGVISARTATVGAVVGVGTELFRMIRQGRLEWRAEVTAAELARLKPGTAAVVKAANGSELTGKVRMIAPTVDAQTRSALVYVDLPPTLSTERAVQGRHVRQRPVRTGRVSERDDGAAAGGGGARRLSYVFRLNQDQRVSQLKVQTGRRLGDRSKWSAGSAGRWWWSAAPAS
jgi:RND family efflux transporter MFP subunit